MVMGTSDTKCELAANRSASERSGFLVIIAALRHFIFNCGGANTES